VTLDDLRGHTFFANWKDYPPLKVIRASRKVMAITVEALVELGPRASESNRMAILQRCIESFNILDAKMHFIETVEREDICEEFEAIVHACGLGAHKDLVSIRKLPYRKEYGHTRTEPKPASCRLSCTSGCESSGA